MSETIRLAVFQIECHPSFCRDRLDFLEEPFIPDSYKSSLSYLGGLGIPVTDIQESIKQEYLDWHKKRLQELLTHPLLNEGVPCIIILPEGSVPIDCLLMLYDFAKSTKATIVAGSHTILDTIEAKEVYFALGKADAFNKGHKHYPDATIIFVDDKIHDQKKQGVSPFDRVDTSALLPHRITLHPIPIPIGDTHLRMVTLVCADALQLPNIKGDYDIVSIISYDPDPSHFDSFLGTQIRNNKAVIYCNDGRFGGSSINLPLDKRPTSWLYEAPLDGKLPVGDTLLIIDVPTGSLATQVGIFNPAAQHEVKLLASITYRESIKGDQEVSKELYEIESIENNQVRNSRLTSLLRRGIHNLNQKHRLEYLLELSRKGIDSENIWAVYGNDLVLGLKGLVDLEASFAETCNGKLVHQFVDGNLEPRNSEMLQIFLRNCRSRLSILGKTTTIVSTKPTTVKEAYINREEEIAKLLHFFDSGNDFLLEVTGLGQIGKSAVIDMALSRTGFQRIKKITLLDTSSARYIISELTGRGKLPLGSTTADLQSSAELQKAIKAWDVLWFENCQQLVVSDKWKTSEIESLMESIIAIVQKGQTNIKVIFETGKALPFDLHDPSLLSKIRISGFERELTKHGMAILDRQLRRLNLNPNDVPMETKTQLVKDLGGHPMAIVFCADAIYDEGLPAVVKAVSYGTGFYREVTDRILNLVALSKEDEQILKVLSGCRIEVPRDVVAAICDFPVIERISNLGRLCLIDIVSPNTIKIPGILRNRFRFNDLDITTRNSLHKNAAMIYSQMAKEFPSRIEFAIEAEYHAVAIGQMATIITDLIDGRFAAAKEFYDMHEFSQALQVLTPLITENASDDIIRLSAFIDAQTGDLSPALAKAEKILSKNPSDTELFFVLGKAALTQSRPELGDKLVWVARKAGVAETRVSILEGRLSLRRKDFPKAEACFRQAISSPRTDPWAYFYLGTTYMRMGNLPEAINKLYDGDQYLTEHPNIRGQVRNAIRAKLGVAYVLSGDLNPASTILENLKNQDPNNPETLYAYWLLTVRKEGVDKASAAFEVFQKARPKKWERGLYHLYYGLFLKALDKLTEANEHFELAHKHEPYNVYIMIQYAENLYNLAITARKEMAIEVSNDRALKCAHIVQRIFEFDPDNLDAQNLQVDLYWEFGIELSDLGK